jgi:hypothetical protein
MKSNLKALVAILGVLSIFFVCFPLQIPATVLQATVDLGRRWILELGKWGNS